MSRTFSITLQLNAAVMFSENRTLTIPSDYGCLAVVDPDAYVGFVDENWD